MTASLTERSGKKGKYDECYCFVWNISRGNQLFSGTAHFSASEPGSYAALISPARVRPRFVISEFLMAAEVKLTKGKVALVDPADLQLVHRYKWQAVNNHGYWYAYGHVAGRRTAMHRLILGPKSDTRVFHIDGNTLNNQRANLSVGQASKSLTDGPLRGYRKHHKYEGVWYDEEGNYIALIWFEGKEQRLGWFYTAELAAKAYDEAAFRLIGPTAAVNFPPLTPQPTN
jgi:hypothetical protein